MVKETQDLQGRKERTLKFWIVTAVVVAMLINALLVLKDLFFPVGCSPSYTHCMNNVHQLAIGFKIYSDEHRGRYPTSEKWCDLLLEDTFPEDSDKIFVCPSKLRSGEKCSYAMNPNAEPNSPFDMVLLFEAGAGWNQFGGQELLATDNHRSKGSTVLFCDYSVRYVKPEEVGQLRWE
jgi:hypothetical protein